MVDSLSLEVRHLRKVYGEIVAVEPDGITVVCADGRFKVARVQPDGSKKIEAAEWAKSANIEKGAKFA